MLIRSLSIFLCSGLALTASAPTFPVLTYSTYLRESFTPIAIATDSAGNIYMAKQRRRQWNYDADRRAGCEAESASQPIHLCALSGRVGCRLCERDCGGQRRQRLRRRIHGIAGFSGDAGRESGDSSDGWCAVQRAIVCGEARSQRPNRIFRSSGRVGREQRPSCCGECRGTDPGERRSRQHRGPKRRNRSTVSGDSGRVQNSQHRGRLFIGLDPTGAKMIFSALGIGGSAIALDPAGNIYVAGSTTQLDYPTTPGVYQTMFPKVVDCGSPDCAFPFPGSNQFVSKVDPTGSTLIYSTAVTGTGNTSNAGLAVDQTGNVYVTGFAGKGYPYTVPVPSLAVEQAPAYQVLPFLSKLDPAGQTLLFSVPVGGAGMQIDSTGGVYVGGNVGAQDVIIGFPADIPALAGVPSQCLPNSGPGTGNHVSAYVAEVDGKLRAIYWVQNLSAGPHSASQARRCLVRRCGLPDRPACRIFDSRRMLLRLVRSDP